MSHAHDRYPDPSPERDLALARVRLAWADLRSWDPDLCRAGLVFLRDAETVPWWG
jgi:hypothetical protein